MMQCGGILTKGQCSTQLFNQETARDSMAHKFKWSEQEDCLLKELKEEKNLRSWVKISQEISRLQTNSRRTPKQCRERYINHVRLSARSWQKTVWSVEDHSLFLDLYRVHGPKWAVIAREMRGRSEIFLKNRFYSSFRKMIRKINAVEQLNKTSKKRLLKYENLLRIIDADKQFKDAPQLTPSNQDFVSHLRDTILNSVWAQEDLSEEDLQGLIVQIHKFNSMFSYFGMRKIKFHLNSKDDELTSNSQEKVRLQSVSGAVEGQENQSKTPCSSGVEAHQDNLLELFDLLEEVELSEKGSQRPQDLEEELSLILKREYVPEQLTFF